MSEERPARIHGRKFLQALMDVGVIRPEDYVRRVVIDASMDSAVLVYVERLGDERLLSVTTSLEGVEINVTAALRAPDGADS